MPLMLYLKAIPMSKVSQIFYVILQDFYSFIYIVTVLHLGLWLILSYFLLRVYGLFLNSFFFIFACGYSVVPAPSFVEKAVVSSLNCLFFVTDQSSIFVWICLLLGSLFLFHLCICLFFHVVVVQSLSCVQLFETPWTVACQASLTVIISQSLLKLMSIESLMPSNHLSHPLLSPSPPAPNPSQHQVYKIEK